MLLQLIQREINLLRRVRRPDAEPDGELKGDGVLCVDRDLDRWEYLALGLRSR